MKLRIAIDLETYYDADYSLRKMSVIEYIRDERFELHIASIISPDIFGNCEPRSVVGAEQFSKLVDHLHPLSETYDLVLIGSNSAFFDALVIKERFGFHFKFHEDTMTDGGWVLGNRLKDRKLETMVQYFDITPDYARRAAAYTALGILDDGNERKISAALNAVKGKRLADIREIPGLLTAYTLYCEQDVLYSWGVNKAVEGLMPEESRTIANLYYNSYLTMPLVVDVPLLKTLKDDYEDTRSLDVEAFGAALPDGVEWEGLKTLRSKDKFAKLLVDLGVSEGEIPLKKGKDAADGSTRMIYAFDKTSMALDDLAGKYEDGESLVPDACRLRLEYNSSNTEGKLNRFAAAGSTGPWAMAVKPFGAANTSRHSGSNATGSSPQNLSRAKPTFGSQACATPIRFAERCSVRDAIGVPEGYELVVCDLSGIEMRTSLTIANDQRYIEILKDPTRDVYVETASKIFEKPLTKKDKDERFVGKLVELSASYGVGAPKLHMTARLWGNPISMEMAYLAHATYRQEHRPLVETWGYYDDLLDRWAGGSVVNEAFSVFQVEQKGIRTPSGFLIQFPDLQKSSKMIGRRRVPVYTYWNASKRCRVNVFFGLIHENCSQAIAAQVFNDMHLRIDSRALEFGGVFCGSVHDELIYRVPVGKGNQMLQIMQEEMGIPPIWWQELPVTSEGDYGFAVLEHDNQFKFVSRYGCLK